jgi:large subunit ribosomal protein L18e
MKMRDKNPILKGVIENLEKDGHKNMFLKAVAKALNRPRRVSYEINVNRLDSVSKSKDIIIVPGSVLGSGSVSKPLTVGALKFSASAEEKIKKAGGKCLSIEEMIEKHPKGSGVRIIG